MSSQPRRSTGAVIKYARLSAFCGVFCFLLAPAGDALAQDVIRPSYAGERAAASRRRLPQPDYNIKIGPVRFKFDASLRTEYSDNIFLQKENKESDIIIEPRLGMAATWPVTRFNSLRLNIGVGYRKYLSHSELDSSNITLSPGSQISFDIFVGDFRITLFDAFSHTEDPVTEGNLANTGKFGRFTNTAGVSVIGDFNQLITTLTYSHTTLLATSADENAQAAAELYDRSIDSVSASVAVPITSTLQVGTEGIASLIRYQNSDLEAQNYSAGGFVETLLTPYLRLRAAAGYQTISFQQADAVQAIEFRNNLPVIVIRDLDEQTSGIYANVSVENRLSRFYTHSLTAGREAQLGLTTEQVQVNFVEYDSSWEVNRYIRVGSALFLRVAEQSGGFTESYTQYGARFTLGYRLTKKITTALSYAIVMRDSDLDRDYVQNRVGLLLTYDF